MYRYKYEKLGKSTHVYELHASLSLLLPSARKFANSHVKAAAILIKSSNGREKELFQVL